MKRSNTLLLLIFAILILILGVLLYIFYFYEGELIDIPIATFAQCAGLEDGYALPDFEGVKEKLSREQMVKDVPSKGKISLKFYHDIGNCRVLDKIYLLRDGKIEERNVKSDVDILISSDYASDIGERNICDVISEAKNNGDLEQSINVGEIKLYLIYKNMLKYKECLGVEV